MTKQSVYEQFDKATQGIGAYAVIANGHCIGRIVFKYPRDGAGRLYCYAHVWGLPMTRGWANGYGYDKQTAAMESAMTRFKLDDDRQRDAAALVAMTQWQDALRHESGLNWKSRLEGAGFTVCAITA